jgi:hypothetical protein
MSLKVRRLLARSVHFFVLGESNQFKKEREFIVHLVNCMGEAQSSSSSSK